jgi:hypothetical protein
MNSNNIQNNDELENEKNEGEENNEDSDSINDSDSVNEFSDQESDNIEKDQDQTKINLLKSISNYLEESSKNVYKLPQFGLILTMNQTKTNELIDHYMTLKTKNDYELTRSEVNFMEKEKKSSFLGNLTQNLFSKITSQVDGTIPFKSLFSIISNQVDNLPVGYVFDNLFNRDESLFLDYQNLKSLKNIDDFSPVTNQKVLGLENLEIFK